MSSYLYYKNLNITDINIYNYFSFNQKLRTCLAMPTITVKCYKH